GQGWYYQQIFRLADNQPPALGRGVFAAFLRYWWDELGTALKLRLAR
ncbi:UNVERIFIED_CONTAM: NADH:flavin oxidoreductase, partial [Salmonella enterica subsp. enterica serovar Weltevreden]